MMLFAMVSVGYCAEANNWGNTDLDPLLRRQLPYDFIHAGPDRGGVSTMVSGTLAIPVSYSVVLMQVGSAMPRTLANGLAGQILTIVVSTGTSTTVLTPTTKTGFTTISFNAVADSVTLLYIDDTIGWLVIGQNSVTIA